MSSTKSLPARPSLEYLKKLAKEQLASLRRRDPDALLADAQLAVARVYGFASWRKLKASVDESRKALHVTAPTEDQVRDFIQALERGDHAIIRRSLREAPALANAKLPDPSSHGKSMLHFAAERNDTRSVGLLLDAGASPEALMAAHTPLSWAVTVGAIDAAKVLAARGPKPDLFSAAGLGDRKLVASFFDEHGHLRSGASRTGSSRFGPDKTRLPCPPEKESEIVADALYVACRLGHASVAKFLLDHKPDLSFQAYVGGTPLHWAYFGGNQQIIKMLLAAGASPSRTDNPYRCTARGFGIHVPSDWGFLRMVRERLKDDPSLAKLFDGGTTPLHRAAHGGHAAVVKFLIEAGADPKARNAEGKTAAEVAREQKHEDVALAIEQVM